MNAPVDRLVHRLRLKPGESPTSWTGEGGVNALNAGGRLFGGFVMAQTIMAAGLSTPDRRIHMLQQVFLRAGRADLELSYDVTTIHDGRTYKSMTVAVHQDGELISHAQVGASAGIDGPDRWEEPARDVVAPADAVDRHRHLGRENWDDQPVEFRYDPARDESNDPTLEVLFRAAGDLPDEPLVHQALLGFATDRALSRVPYKPHRGLGDAWSATLNHTIWFHRPIDLGGWHRHIMDSPSMGDGRGLAQGHVYADDDRLVASVTQEATFRPA